MTVPDVSVLPYGPSFRMVDRVLVLEAGRRIVTVTSFDLDRPILEDHFLGGPHVVPGVLLIEMSCQSALLLAAPAGAADALFLLGQVRASFRAPAQVPVLVQAETTVDSTTRDASMFHSDLRAGDVL